MKMLLSTIYIFLLVVVINFFTTAQTIEAKKNYTIVIRGGAGIISRDMPDSIKNDYLKSLEQALSIGLEMLKKGKTSIDVVEEVVKYLEDDPKFNAGKGAVFNSEGKHELDASIMDGRDLSCGAVAGVKTIKNPISLAKLVMKETPHLLLVGEGAEKFAKVMGVDVVPNEYFDTPLRYEQWQKSTSKEFKGTVGCVALDIYDNLAAATSTGGVTNKMPGRVGDSPSIGAGTYADNSTCAVSCTGKGELFIKHNVAFNISALMKYKNYSLKLAAEEMIHKIIPAGNGGLIAVDKNGNYAMVFNTSGMFRAVANSEGVFEVKIWE